MQTVSRDVTSTEISDVEKTLKAVPFDVLHALLDGVSKKKVHKASEVATIIFRWVKAHTSTIETIHIINGGGGK